MAALADPAAVAVAAVDPTAIDPSDDDRDPDISLLTQPPLLRALGIARQTLFRWRQLSDFPTPLEINGRLYWRRAEIARWLDSRPRRSVGPADSPEATQARRDWIADVRERAADGPPRLGRPRKPESELAPRSRRRRLAEARAGDPAAAE